MKSLGVKHIPDVINRTARRSERKFDEQGPPWRRVMSSEDQRSEFRPMRADVDHVEGIDVHCLEIGKSCLDEHVASFGHGFGEGLGRSRERPEVLADAKVGLPRSANVSACD